MKLKIGMWSGLLAVASLAAGASAQPVGGPGCAAPPPCLTPGMGAPPGMVAPPGTEGNPRTANPGPDEGGAGASALSGESGARRGNFQGNLTSTSSGLTGSTTLNTNMAAPGQPSVANRVFTSPGSSVTTSQIPLILPGMFTAAQTESALPMDRVFFGYGYYNRFRTAGPAGTTPGFNLNAYDVGVEKTLLDGRASVYVQVPFLDASNNTTGAAIDGLGDVSAGFKFVIFGDTESGSLLSAGVTASAPTARDLTVTTSTGRLLDPTNTGAFPPGLNAFLPNVTTTVNPTFLQPWIAGSLGMDRLSIQDYLGLVIPTDDRVATFFNDDLGVSYQVYRCEGDRLLTSAAVTCDVQFLIPINHQGSSAGAGTTRPAPFFPDSLTLPPLAPPLSLNMPDQVFVTPGLEFGLGSRAVLSTGVVVPVAGPKAFSVGTTIGLNLFF